MSHVLTLVCSPGRPVLDEALLAAASSHLPSPGAPVWLADGVAADIPFAPMGATNNRRIADMLRLELGDAPVDLFVQASAHRR